MKRNRRRFLKDSVGIIGLSSLYPMRLLANASEESMNSKIDNIELFRYDVNIPVYFSFGTWYNRQHLFMKITSGNYCGWSEVLASHNDPDFNPAEYVNYLKPFKGLTIDKSLKLLLSQQVHGTRISTKKLEFIEMGLLDLMGRIQNKPAIELLGLHERNPVPGLYCILEKDVERAKAEAQNCKEHNLTHLKFKMYGEKEIDLTLLRTIREILGKSAVVISDVNEGYKEWESLQELASILVEFRNNGLNGIEDPAHLEATQWIQLQKMVGELSLIPDYAMRPAWEGLKRIQSGMGRIYNLHPATMGSFKYTAELARKVKELNATVMIGDDSLVGPGCTAWQQIAIGAGACWVEAIEKEGDSEQYLECVRSSATYKDNKGNYGLDPKPGFGLELAVDDLKKICSDYIKI